MKKIIFILLLFITVNVYAIDYNIDGFYVDATILENGDLLVKEAIIQRGSFNGYYRRITKSSFETVNDLYNATDIELVRICRSDLTTFEAVNNPIDCFEKVNQGNLGDKGVYEINNLYNGIEYKMFNHTKNSFTTFYIEYILKNVAIKYNDIGELRWNFVPNEFVDDIGDLEIRVNLKKDQDILRVWSHGPLYVENKILDKNTINVTTTNLPKNTYVDIRMVFDSNYLMKNTKMLIKIC